MSAEITISNINWNVLRRQKSDLLILRKETSYIKLKSSISGIVHLIDYIQDSAVIQGIPKSAIFGRNHTTGAEHRCNTRGKDRLYGAAIIQCYEDSKGRFWATNDKYETQVDYCPICGLKAIKATTEGLLTRRESNKKRNTTGKHKQ